MSSKEAMRKIVAGKQSGKRKLTDVLAAEAAERKENVAKNVASRFFQSGYNARSDAVEPSCNGDKNERILVDDSDDDGAVQQEDGYISPSPTISRVLTPDLSSPHRLPKGDTPDIFDDKDGDLSSPILRNRKSSKPRDTFKDGPSRARVLVEQSPEPSLPSPSNLAGPDLASLLHGDTECASDEASWESNDAAPETQLCSPCDATTSVHSQVEDIDEHWNEEDAGGIHAHSVAKVLRGWRERYSFDKPVGTPGAVTVSVNERPSLNSLTKRFVALSLSVGKNALLLLKQIPHHLRGTTEVATL
jgi:hypothetical protein